MSLLARLAQLALDVAPRPGGLAELARVATQLPTAPRDASCALWLHAQLAPDALAVVDGARRTSRGELEALVERAADALAAAGVGPGAPLAMALGNRVELLAVQLACQRLGADLVQCPSKATAGELVALLAASGARRLVGEPTAAATLAQVSAAAGVPAEPLEALLERPAPPRTRPLLPRAADLLLFTSGSTTGRPRGTRRPVPRALPLPLVDLFARLGLRRDDVHLVSCPLYHAAAPLFAFATLAVGGAVVFGPSPWDGAAALELMARERVTSAFLVPTQLARLCDAAARGARTELPALRWVVSGAAALPPAVATRTLGVLGPRLWNMYGATETGVVTVASPEDLAAEPASIGAPLAGVRVALRDDAGRDVPGDAPGELWVQSAMTLAGYENDAEATAASARDGWFSVGDLARRTARDGLVIVDRLRDLVNTGGVKVAPREVEDVLLLHPAVRAACVVGVPDAAWGEAVVAFVELAPPAPNASGDAAPDARVPDDGALVAHCRAHLAAAKLPRRIVRLAPGELPVSPTGKPDRRALRARLL